MIKHFYKSFILRNYSLLFFVVTLVFAVPLFPISWHDVLFDVFFTLVYLMATLTLEKNRRPLLITAIIMIGSLWLSYIETWPILNISSKVLAILFFCFVVGSFISMISRSKKVNAKVILESINGYLLMSIMFTLIIAVIMFYNKEAFSFPEGSLYPGENVNNFSNYMYYTLVTMSTLGYGDVVPHLPYAKSLATFISVSGQLYIAIIIAMLVGKFASQKDE